MQRRVRDLIKRKRKSEIPSNEKELTREEQKKTVTYPDHTLPHGFPPYQRDEALVDFRLWQICRAYDLPDCKSIELSVSVDYMSCGV
jgi:hypothetical protein